MEQRAHEPRRRRGLGFLVPREGFEPPTRGFTVSPRLSVRVPIRTFLGVKCRLGEQNGPLPSAAVRLNYRKFYRKLYRKLLRYG